MNRLICFSWISLLFFISPNTIGQEKEKYLFDFYCKQERYDSAQLYSKEFAAMIRGKEGENSAAYAEALHILATAHEYTGQFNRAIYFAQKEIQLRESLKQTDKEEYLRALNHTVRLYLISGNYEAARELLKKSEKFILRYRSAYDISYGLLLYLQGTTYNLMGAAGNDMIFLRDAGDYYNRASLLLVHSTEKSNQALMANTSGHASLASNSGNIPLAESRFLEVVSYFDSLEGRESVSYASAANNLAVFYYSMGSYKMAERYFHEAVEIARKKLPSKRNEAFTYINNLASLYHDLGNFDAALILFKEADEIFQSFHTPEHPHRALLLNNIASCYLSRDYYAEPSKKNRQHLYYAGKLLVKADSIFSLNCKMPDPRGYAIKNNLSLWYKLTGDTARSLDIMNEIVQQSNISMRPVSMIRKMILLPTSGEFLSYGLAPSLLSIQVGITDHMYDEKVLEYNTENQSLATRAIINMVVGKANNIQKALGPYHPGYIAMLKGLAPLYRSFGSLQVEEEMMLKIAGIIRHNTLQDFSFLSDNEKEYYYQTRLPDWHSFFSYALKRKQANPKITGFVYDYILMNKGLMLKSSTAMRMAIQNSNNPQLIKDYDAWIEIQKKISALNSTPVDMRSSDLDMLVAQANEMEKSLVQRSQIFQDYRKEQELHWTDVQKNLKEDEAAIEFIHFRNPVKDKGTPTVYCALVVRKNSLQPEMIMLFEEEKLLALLGNSIENDETYIQSLYGTRQFPKGQLHQLIWKPMESVLQGIHKVYVSPSGLLHRISFGSLQDEQQMYLCNRYQIHIKGNTGNQQKSSFGKEGGKISALVFGGIDYGYDKSGLQLWNYLAGTRTEGARIKNILSENSVDVSLYSESTATETELKQHVQNKNLLHIATHGFFFPDPASVALSGLSETEEMPVQKLRGKMRGFGVQSFVNNPDPLMRSGLVFAGANEVWDKATQEKGDDGVLTAMEVTHLNLKNLSLVVLSACETGLGDIKGNEGVYGMQRAFKMAGVQFMIISLWQVPDMETVEFMEQFYSSLLQSGDIHEAFTTTQRRMSEKYDPFYWAAFELIE